ncbi:MAG: HhH-GPD-type base excision DNA repair protein [Acidimicrobiales bacterium]
MPIRFTDDPNELVNSNPMAFLAAMLLDQQVPITWAFAGPQRLVDRLAIEFTAPAIAALDRSTLAAAAAEKPAIHRYHKTMAHRLHDLAQWICDQWDGDVRHLLATDHASELADRLGALPGFGDEKVKITIAALVKRFDYTFVDWERVAAPFSDDQPRSVADIGDPAALVAVRLWKKGQRDAGRSKQDSPAG